MKKKLFRMAIDQFGNKYCFMTIGELQKKVGGGKISKMFVDKKDGTTVCTGRVIGSYWLDFFVPYEEAIL